MISQLSLTAFKRFARFDLPMAPLTVLTGTNGSGKSTIVQALLLAHQTCLGHGDTVPLSAEPGLDLGLAADVLNEDAASNTVEIGIGDGTDHRWVFDSGSAGRTEHPYLTVVSRPDAPPAPFGRRDGSMVYLSAERLGPRTSHPSSPVEVSEAVVGEDGRFVAHALAVNNRREVLEARRHPSAGEVSTMIAQTEAWLSSLVGPTQIEAELVPRTGISTLRLRTPGRGGRWLLPTNTGFGISYALPVLVAGLLVPVGGLLVVDSPEAHLHPAAQSAIGRFLAMLAGSGVQVVLETHSDHVLNGVRRAVALDQTVRADDVQVTFFGRGADPVLLSLDDKGRLSAWPDSFFDQLDKDLRALTRRRT